MKGYVTTSSEFIIIAIYSVLFCLFFSHPILLFISMFILADLQPVHYFNPADGKATKNQPDIKEAKGDD